MPVKESYFSNAELYKRDLENVLLIRGWSRYKWTDVLKMKAADTLRNAQELVFNGQVSKYTGKFKESVPVLTFIPTGAYNTDINGMFSLPDSNIVTERGKKITLMVANDRPADYKIQMVNPYDSLNKKLAQWIDPVFNLPAQENSASFRLATTEHAIQLKEAVIKDKKDNSFYESNKREEFGTNSCGDYVCMYNILNCPNHRSGRPAVVGEVYQGRLYTGCRTIPLLQRPNSISFKGIYAAQEFYPSDYSEINPSQPEYVSTLYWKSQLMLKKGEAKEVSFYTSDITGPFKVIVQGITDNDVIYGETSFRVTK